MKTETIKIIPVLFGEVVMRPLKGFPDGEITIIRGNAEFVKASVTKNGKTRIFYVKEENGYWMPSHEQGRNQTV